MSVIENNLWSSLWNLNLIQEEPIYCVCRSTSSGFMIECSFCKEWYHGDCIGIAETEVGRIDTFCCEQCKSKDPALRTTYKEIYNRRKIKRAKRRYKNSTMSKNFEDVSDLVSDPDYVLLNTIKTSTVFASDFDTNTCRRCQFLEIFSHQWKSRLSAADEFNCKKLTDIHAKLHNIEKESEELDIKLIKLIDRIRKSKKPENNFIKLPCDDNTALDAEDLSKFTESRFEQIYMELEKDSKLKINDEKWNIFCNQKIAKNSWCKKLKVLCPLHYENSRKDGEICGYNLSKENGTDLYCGNKDSTCNHHNWEELLRAEVDLDKLTLFLQFKALKREEINIQEDMSGRGIYILRLMSEYSFEH